MLLSLLLLRLHSSPILFSLSRYLPFYLSLFLCFSIFFLFSFFCFFLYIRWVGFSVFPFFDRALKYHCNVADLMNVIPTSSMLLPVGSPPTGCPELLVCHTVQFQRKEPLTAVPWRQGVNIGEVWRHRLSVQEVTTNHVACTVLSCMQAHIAPVNLPQMALGCLQRSDLLAHVLVVAKGILHDILTLPRLPVDVALALVRLTSRAYAQGAVTPVSTETFDIITRYVGAKYSLKEPHTDLVACAALILETYLKFCCVV